MPPAESARSRSLRPVRLEGRAGTALIDEYMGAYMVSLANRLSAGASAYYRRHWGVGMAEWRVLVAVGGSRGLIVREVAEAADLDNAAASKSLKLLKDRGLVDMRQTQRRGRAAEVSLTPEGLALCRKLRAASRRRNERLMSGFNALEAAQLWALLRKLEPHIATMNAE